MKSVRITRRSHFFRGYNKNKTDPVFYRENNGRRIAKGRDNIPCIVLEKNENTAIIEEKKTLTCSLK